VRHNAFRPARVDPGVLPRLLLAGSLLTALLAGCVGDKAPEDLVDDGTVLGLPGYLYDGAGDLFAGEALYRDPQNTPHPAYNWPTLTSPASGPDVPRWWKPNNGTALPAAFTAIEPIGRAQGVTSGAGIALFGSLAVVPSFSAAVNSTVVDISDPTNPRVLGEMQGINSRTGQGLSHRGATIIAYPTGRLVTVISTGALLDVWDITDPTHPVQLPQIFPSEGSHKVGVLPGTPFVYNANSDGADRPSQQVVPGAPAIPDQTGIVPGNGLGFVEIYDLSDPDAPDPTNTSLVQKWVNGYGCHHLYFWNDLDLNKSRGVCAAIQFTQIWDTSDPANPTVIESIPFGSGGSPAGDGAAVVFPASLSHYAGLSLDGTILMMGDEWGGGGTTPPGCTARVDIPGVGAVSIPLGAVWFYDITVETEPELLGWYSAAQSDQLTNGATPQETSCTAHHGRLVPFADRDVLAMSFYGAGVIVIDFTALRNEQPGLPMTVAQFADGSNTWETWYYNGHLYTGDLNRGMDVLEFA
jgi:hypothetical protein